MKLLLSITGTIFTASFTLGFLFKMMYWPGANDLLWLGNIGFGLIFIPLLCFFHLKKAWTNGSLIKHAEMEEKQRHVD